MKVTRNVMTPFNSVKVIFLLLILTPSTEQYRRNSHKIPFNITASTGITVDLKCKVRLNECGHFYSIEWYWQKERSSGNSQSHHGDDTFLEILRKAMERMQFRLGMVLHRIQIQKGWGIHSGAMHLLHSLRGFSFIDTIREWPKPRIDGKGGQTTFTIRIVI